MKAMSEEDCGGKYQKLALETREDVQQRFEKEGASNPVDWARDWASEQLQWAHGRAYPIAHFDDATPLKAKTLALQSYGLSKGEQAFSLQELQAELSGTLDRVEKFGSTYNAYVEETAQKAIRLKQMQDLELKVLPLTGTRAENLEFKMPFIRKTLFDEKGAFQGFDIGERTEFFSNRNEFLLELERLRGSLAERMKAPLWGLSSEAKVIGQQAEDLQKLKIYFSAARSVQSRAPEGVAVDSASDALYQRMSRLFAGGEAPAVKWQEVKPGEWSPQNKATRLPYWAWRDLRWKEFWGEMRGIYQKDLPRLADAAKNDKILQMVRNMSPEEQRALGVSKLASDLSFLGRNKLLNILATAGGGGLSVWELGAKGFDYFLADSVAKEKCAAEAQEEKFVACMQAYLAGKFGNGSPILKNITKNTLSTPARIADEAARHEIEDAISRRKRYQGAEAEKTANQAVYARRVREVLAFEDPGSQAFRQRVVASPDEAVFLLGLLGSPQKPGLLPSTYPDQFARNEELVRQILKEPNQQSREKALLRLRTQGAAPLANEISKLLVEHQRARPISSQPSR